GLDALCVGITTKKVNFVFDADIRSFFDEVSQNWLVRFVEHRIGDPRIIRLIRKWLKAGVLEDGIVTISDKGTGQGSVISPLLANVYLHYTFDLWAERWRRHEATGDMIIVRYADDIIVGFEHEADARRFWDAMRKRLEEFSLSLHPDKTRPRLSTGITMWPRGARRAKANGRRLAHAGSRLKPTDVFGRPRLISQPSSRTRENRLYGMIGGIEETSASFEARSAPRSYPTAGGAGVTCVPTAILGRLHSRLKRR